MGFSKLSFCACDFTCDIFMVDPTKPILAQGFSSDYGDGPPNGSGPRPERIRPEGNQYLKAEFPQLDGIKQMTLITPSHSP